MTNTNIRPVAAATDIQAAWIRLLTSKNGATRAQLQEASGSAFPPDAWHLTRLADRYGFKFEAWEIDGSREKTFTFKKKDIAVPSAKAANSNARRKAAAERIPVMKRMGKAADAKRKARAKG